jgi:RNA polymerase primary sigma factor
MSIGKYYDKIMEEPLLGKEEEFDLFLEYQDEGITEARRAEIRDRIIRANLRFVFKQAKHFSKSDPEMFEELIGAGNEGLIVGIEKFLPQEGYRFLTYAGWWVKQRILERMSTQRIVSLPTWKQQLGTKIQKAIDANDGLSFEELKPLFPDVPEKVLFEMYQTRYLTFYIEDMQEDSSFEINPIEDEVDARLDREKLHKVIRELPDPMNKVIFLSFGLLDGDEKKPLDIARELGLTKDQVRSYKNAGLARIRELIGDASLSGLAGT